jgi:ferredoxin
MFSQLLGFNTNKCNGCPKRCEFGAVESKRKKGRFMPTIDSKPYGFYYDKNNIRHNIRPLANKYKTIDTARLIAHTCPKYMAQYSTITATAPNQCIGCKSRCELGTIETNQGFMPTIQHKPIFTYINSYGNTENITPHPTQNAAQELTIRIARRCDFYKIPLKSTKKCQTK